MNQPSPLFCQALVGSCFKGYLLIRLPLINNGLKILGKDRGRIHIGCSTIRNQGLHNHHVIGKIHHHRSFPAQFPYIPQAVNKLSPIPNPFMKNMVKVGELFFFPSNDPLMKLVLPLLTCVSTSAASYGMFAFCRK